jgi:hypothetical protein
MTVRYLRARLSQGLVNLGNIFRDHYKLDQFLSKNSRDQLNISQAQPLTAEPGRPRAEFYYLSG